METESTESGPLRQEKSFLLCGVVWDTIFFLCFLSVGEKLLQSGEVHSAERKNIYTGSKINFVATLTKLRTSCKQQLAHSTKLLLLLEKKTLCKKSAKHSLPRF